MLAPHKRTWIVGLAVALAIVLFGAIAYLQPRSATAGTPCPPDWAQSSSGEARDRCAEQKQIVSVQREQAERTAKAGQPYVQRWPGFTPQKLPKPTGEDVGPQEIPLQNMAGGPAAMRYASSVWQIDYVSNGDQTAWSPLYVVAFGGENNGRPMLQTVLLNRFTPDMSRYEHLWTCPRALGTLTITGVTGLNGIVAFTSASGQTGSFNMATEQWIFNP